MKKSEKEKLKAKFHYESTECKKQRQIQRWTLFFVILTFLFVGFLALKSLQ